MGRPRGSQNRAGTREIHRLRARSDRAWDVIDQKLAEGCVKSALFILQRLLPDSRSIELDGIDPASIGEAIAAGEVTPPEAIRLSQAAKHLADVETVDALRGRLDQIEAILSAKGRT
jgi:hypothetical protein